MKRFQVFRTHLSPYQSKNFKELEGNALNSIPGIEYLEEPQATTNDLILLTNTHTDLGQLPDGLLERTKLIVHPNSGYDNFSKDHSLWKNIPTIIGHTIRAQGVAEYILSSLFQLQDLPQHLAWDKKRNWERRLTSDLNIWVYGIGHIGTIVSETLRSIGAKVTIVDPFKMNLTFDQVHHWKDGNRSEVDVHILCCGLNSSSHHLLNKEFFQNLKHSAVIINGARGKLIEEKALRDFLQSNPEAFAFLDVFEEEPFGNQWHHFPQVWKTSHIAGVSRDLDQKIINFEVQVLKSFMSDFENFSSKYHDEILQNKFINGVLI